MLRIDPKESSLSEVHNYLLGAIAPRPIAFVSTIDEQERVNLAPFSFFNAFSAKPPIVVFSPARSGRTNKNKHTFNNVSKVRELVINLVNYDLVYQTSLASSEFEEGVNEFVKSGLTEVPSEFVKPPRVLESPVQLECKVRDIITLGDLGGAGNLVICEVVLMHIDRSILGDDGKIDSRKIKLVGRMGGNYYCKTEGDALFEIAKPIAKIGMGVDALPSEIKNSKYLSGNSLGKLGTYDHFPEISDSERAELMQNAKTVCGESATGSIESTQKLHLEAERLLQDNQIEVAWKLLLLDQNHEH